MIKLTTNASNDSLATRCEKHCWIYETRLADLLDTSHVAYDRLKMYEIRFVFQITCYYKLHARRKELLSRCILRHFKLL